MKLKEFNKSKYNVVELVLSNRFMFISSMKINVICL